MKTTTERFLSKYKRNEETGCLEWTGKKDKEGYGKLRFGTSEKRAHRVSFELFNGPIPEGHCVCHTCDNPSCVNPEHLFVGTQHDNMKDMTKKGRHVGYSKLSEKEVSVIFGVLQKQDGRGITTFLARWFGVDTTTIQRIASGKCWSHLNPINQSLTV